jgi:ABC-2 type transport system ATP-binding protein
MNEGAVVYDDSVAAMRGDLLGTKLVDVGLAAPVPRPDLDGVTVTTHEDHLVRLAVDTTRRSVRDVLDLVLDRWPVADISVLDPPLEQVIAEIYAPRVAP